MPIIRHLHWPTLIPSTTAASLMLRSIVLDSRIVLSNLSSSDSGSSCICEVISKLPVSKRFGDRRDFWLVKSHCTATLAVSEL